MSLGSAIVTDKPIGNRDGAQPSYNNAAGLGVEVLEPLRVKMNCAKGRGEIDEPPKSSKRAPDSRGE